MFLAWLYDAIANFYTKIVTYGQPRVNGGSNYEYPGQRRVLKPVTYKA